MHPALSVIFFTAVSGCGFGMLVIAGALLVLAPQSLPREAALVAFVLGGALATTGLISSTLHLGQPQRAWRALSQWRSSWLSREGVAALATFVPLAGAVLAAWHGDEGLLRVCAAALAVLAAATIVCTARIYTCLPTIPAWSDPRVLPGYLLFAALGGGAWFAVVAYALALDGADPVLFGATLAGAAAAVLKDVYWRALDREQPPATIESATGLGRFGAVRQAEAPHTEANYLTREMGFVLARRHAERLRAIAVVLFALVPVLATALALFLPGAFGWPGALVAALAVTTGIFVERWLFFAQARHVVMLYYGDGARRPGERG